MVIGYNDVDPFVINYWFDFIDDQHLVSLDINLPIMYCVSNIQYDSFKFELSKSYTNECRLSTIKPAVMSNIQN